MDQRAGTVQPALNFNPEEDAAVLRTNLRGFATSAGDEEIINVLARRTNAQRREISFSYHGKYGRDLCRDVKSELTGNFQSTLLAMLMSPAEHDVVCLNKAMKGLGTDEKGCRESADVKVSPTKAKEEAEELLRLNTGQTEYETLLDIFCCRSLPQLKETLAIYGKLKPRCDMVKWISNELNGDFKDAMKTVVKVAEHTPTFFAEKLYRSMKGAGTDDSTLIRIIVSRSEVDLLDIKECFLTKYGKSLEKFIEGDTSGSYRKLLIAIVS